MTAVALAALLAFVAFFLGESLSLSSSFLARVLILHAIVSAAVVGMAAVHLQRRSFGVPNRVTLMRASVAALVAAYLGEAPSAGSAWVIVAAAIAILLLDGLDGRLARRTGAVSTFGARFDLETDAALTLILCALCWQLGKAGAWILFPGMIRYAFVAGGWLMPWLARPLPYSRRRQTVCVLQISGLLAVLSPLFPVPASSVVGVVIVFMIAWSFAVDIGWLHRYRHSGKGADAARA